MKKGSRPCRRARRKTENRTFQTGECEQKPSVGRAGVTRYTHRNLLAHPPIE
jgi:hypothetical protein